MFGILGISTLTIGFDKLAIALLTSIALFFVSMSIFNYIFTVAFGALHFLSLNNFAFILPLPIFKDRYEYMQRRIFFCLTLCPELRDN